MTKDQEAKFLKVLGAFIEHNDKSLLLLREMSELLSGGESIGTKLKQVEATWGTLWELRYKSRYVWSYAKERAGLKRLLACMEPAHVEARMIAYLHDPDPFYGKDRHPLLLFVAHVNRFAPPPTSSTFELTPPIDCAHEPRCTTDQEHTKKRTADLRKVN